MPKLAYGPSVANTLPEGVVGWRAAVQGLNRGKLLLTVIGEEGTPNAKVPFTMDRIRKAGVYAITD